VKVEDLVFVDEFGANTKMQRTHGRAAPGQRVVARVPHGHYKNLTTIAALTHAGIAASLTFDHGGTTATRFIDFVKRVLPATLRPGRVVVLDNLAAHHHRTVRELIEAAGCRLVHLPAYSPDYNPIENAISKVKSVLRKLAHRTVPALLEAIPATLSRITATDAIGFIGHSGYATK
jgi:transposase